jgi:hypothetical protein
LPAQPFALVVALIVVAMASGCTGSGGPPPGTGSPTGTTSVVETSSSAASQIPPGREIAEGGGGPVSYTFREEWRRALATAEAWRSGAYLVTAVGVQVNDQGIPSSWRLTFADKPTPDAILLVDIDPWGKVTKKQGLTGADATGLVGGEAKPIPYDVIDSDAAVANGQEALAASRGLADTKDPRITLSFDRTDGTGPYWSYILFYEPTAEYVTVRIEALTGKIAPGP